MAAVLLFAALAAGITLATTAMSGGAAQDKGAAVRAAGVDDVVAQVQNEFGDGRIVSASVNGSQLAVKLASTDSAAVAIGDFEAGVLGHEVADWMAAHNQPAVTTVSEVDASGNPLAGAAFGDSVGSEPNVATLAAGTCEAAAQDAPSSLVLASARTLPLARGTCVFKLTAGDPAAFATTASSSLSSITSAIPNANDHPFLVEVDDQAGTPQVILSWVPAIGGQGQGQAYVRPGLPNTLGWGD